MPYPRLSGIWTVPYAPASRTKTYTVIRCHALPPSSRSKEVLAFRRRPAISLGAGTAHQHRPFGVAQPVGLQEGLDGLLVIDDGERARPVRAPQAAIETPGIEQASQRVPDVGERIGLPRQRAGAADLDHRVLAFGEFQHFRQVGPGLRRRG